ncbi:MAG: hypothetical protein JJU19_05755 [Pararhodobacter sp.]|nr:hypothetical protein [Pararhodobacter sp.]
MTGKILVAVCAVAACAVAGAPAAAQDAEYRGGGYVSDSSGCEAHGWAGISQFSARFLPVGRYGNEAASLSMYFGTWAKNYRFPRDFPFDTWMDVTEFGGVGDNVFAFSPDPPPRIRLSLPPVTTTIGGSEAELHYLLEFQNFGDLAGCTIRGELWVRRL